MGNLLFGQLTISTVVISADKKLSTHQIVTALL